MKFHNLTVDDIIQGDNFKSYYTNKSPKILFSKIDVVLENNFTTNTNNYVITHNGDLPVTDMHINYSPDINKWFGQNIITTNSKAVPLPIGLENDYNHFAKQKKLIVIDYCKNHNDDIPENLIYSNFRIENNIKERSSVYTFFNNKSWCTLDTHNSIDLPTYYNKIYAHKFIVCPIGGGLDCHRNWEVLYMNRFPVMKKMYSLEKLYSDLPVLFVDDWHEITEEFLLYKYREMKSKTYNLNKLMQSYWFKLIDKSITCFQ